MRHWIALLGMVVLGGLVGLGSAQQVAALRQPPMFVQLGRPAGDGPFPAVVLLHGCSGITSIQRAWANRLTEWGYVTLVVDSFGPREVRNVCWTGPDGPGNFDDRVLDAQAALLHLRKLRYVDRERVAIMGWSMGAGVTLRTVTGGAPALPDGPPTARFKAAVAFYPYCNPVRRYSTPLLVLIGEQDDWTPAERCQRFVRGRRAGEGRVQLVVYPNAYHSFDASIGVHRYRGHRVGADPEAREDSFERVHAFLAKHL